MGRRSNKTDKPLARLTKKKRKKTQISKIRNERGVSLWIPQMLKGNITNNSTFINFMTLDKIGQFLERQISKTHSRRNR